MSAQGVDDHMLNVHYYYYRVVHRQSQTHCMLNVHYYYYYRVVHRQSQTHCMLNVHYYYYYYYYRVVHRQRQTHWTGAKAFRNSGTCAVLSSHGRLNDTSYRDEFRPTPDRQQQRTNSFHLLAWLHTCTQAAPPPTTTTTPYPNPPPPPPAPPPHILCFSKHILCIV